MIVFCSLGVERKDLKWLKAFDNRVEETFHLSTLSPGGEPLQVRGCITREQDQ